MNVKIDLTGKGINQAVKDLNVYMALLVVTLTMVGCKKSDDKKDMYEFTKTYCAQITVGGAVGIMERCFSAGDRVEGTNVDSKTVSIRVAAHTQQNDKPANSATFQEFLNVPAENLRLITK